MRAFDAYVPNKMAHYPLTLLGPVWLTGSRRQSFSSGLTTPISPGFETLRQSAHKPLMVFLSGSLLNDRLDAIPDSMREITFITYPWRLPEERRSYLEIVGKWLRARKIPVTNLEISSKMYFLGWLMTDAFMHMKSHFYRDYFLDVIGMLRDQTYTIALYPRVSFGPGQRYASKGCYIVQMTRGSSPEVVRRSDWVIH